MAQNNEKEEIKVSGGEKNKQYLRENIHLVYSTAEFSEVQMNLFFVGLNHIDLKPNDVEDDRIYRVEFHRSEIPRYSEKEDIEKELETLNDIKIISTTESGWTSLKPFPKVGAYNQGTIQIWFLGEYLRPILKLKKKEGWAVFLVAEMLSLRGYHAKKLFSIFAAVKNRIKTRLEHELDYLKRVLGIPDKYKGNPGMFMKMVVYPAVNQINEKTSIHVDAEYRKKKGAHPAMVIFDVKRQEKVESQNSKEKPEQRHSEEKQQEPHKHLGEEFEQAKKYFGLQFPGEVNNQGENIRYKCYEQMRERYGFPKDKAFNCAKDKETTMLFFRWQLDNGWAAQVGKSNRKDARDDFFKELKANSLKI